MKVDYFKTDFGSFCYFARSSVVSSETRPHEVSFDATLQAVTPASGSFLSSATTAALRALANSHMW